MSKLAIATHTLPSIELVDLINGMREPGRTVLRHDNFMVKLAPPPELSLLNF